MQGTIALFASVHCPTRLARGLRLLLDARLKQDAVMNQAGHDTAMPVIKGLACTSTLLPSLPGLSACSISRCSGREVRRSHHVDLSRERILAPPRVGLPTLGRFCFRIRKDPNSIPDSNLSSTQHDLQTAALRYCGPWLTSRARGNQRVRYLWFTALPQG
ncbi:hypothetical protein VTI74DRAFT_9025 [Chaetomium olivicolor]